MKNLEKKSTMKYQILILLMLLIISCKQNTEPIETEESSVINSLFWLNDVDDYFIAEYARKDYNSKDPVLLSNPLDVKLSVDSLYLTRLIIYQDNPNKLGGIGGPIKFNSRILKKSIQNNGIINYQIESNQFPYDWSLDSNTYDLIYKKGTFKGTMEFEKVDFFGKDCYQLRIKGSLTKLNNERIDSIKFTYSTCHLYD